MGKHLQASGTPTTGQVPTYNGTSVAWATPSNGSGVATLSFTNLDQGASAGTLTTQATASIAPGANKLILATVSIRNGSSINPTAPTLSGNGLTWVQVGNANLDNSSTSRRTVYLFRAMGASPSAGAVTITFGETETDVAWVIDQVTNAATTGTNGSGAVIQAVSGVDLTGSTSTLSITLAALAASTNATYGAFGTDGAATPTAGAGYTALGHGASGSNETADTEYKLVGSTTVNFSWGATGGLGGIAIEIAPASTTPITALTTTGSGAATVSGSTLNIPTPPTAPVTSVAGRTGVVTLTADDTPDGTTNKAYPAADKTKLSGITAGADVTATQLPVATHAATGKTTPVDADEVNIADSAASFGLKKVTWANIKATLKTYFDTLYQAVLVSGTSIKTINGSSVLGSGDLTVTGGSSGAGWLDYYHLSNTSFAGRYYSSPANGKALTASTVATGKLYATPFLVGKSTSFDQIGMNVTTLVSSSTAHIGIYTNKSDTNLYPDQLIVDSGALSTAGTGNQTAAITQTLAPGLYWLVSTFSGAIGVRSFNTDNLMPLLGYDFGAGVGQGWSATFTYAALPATFPTAGQAVLTAPPFPLIGVRVA